MSVLDVIAFDADDTLWHTEGLYSDAQARFRELLSGYHPPEWIDERLYRTEMHNLEHFGYGIKAFALSMIETAVELTEGRITGNEVQKIIDIAREMINADIRLLAGVTETLATMARTYPLMVITKGDLRDQEIKIARSGLANYFKAVEIVSDKSRESYAALLGRHGFRAERILMVGNSLRSDILPVLEMGGNAVFIPYAKTWLHESADLPPESQKGFYRLQSISELPALVQRVFGS
jgi:putative hydrolase of the HAD superfamily